MILSQETPSRQLDILLNVSTAVPNPGRHQPGTLREQIEALNLYLDDPTRFDDPDGAWNMARRLTMPYARGAHCWH